MMGFIWFWIVAVMIAAYVVFDGFDLGVGILYPFLGRSEQDRATLIQSIGPVWDGNEVWLLAGGGTLFFAFPQLYASSFSGFYLPLIIVLWLLIMRGLGIELRGHIENDLWRTLFGGLFTISSILLAVFYGAALANVIRGVPLDAQHNFFLPLWTNWQVGPHPGILDWYTVIGGVVALVALAMHGGLWVALKTTGDLSRRASQAAGIAWIAVCVITLVSLVATIAVQPLSLHNYRSWPALDIVPAAVVLSLGGVEIFRRMEKLLQAFLASCAYLIFMLVGAAAGLYPILLPSSSSPQTDLTIANSQAGPYTLHVGLIWWIIGMALAGGYFVTSYWMFRGKAEGHYHI
ncbi:MULTISPECIES: cytochrome d ubiquinol oxidase subunit II [Acidobacterium]|uniref:Cytochrome d ubiquinol oxidase, subunit II n=1 Tax=Acidobacterium capsulatum (strain ATCC 51196 / DSM 11244 / BCRC 80197 / JCM 7670 / NBRC 15755 / NCIMB 13165 / 161) TaxID=240015 RepID=C1F0W8_ACIC5|nr:MULTISPECIES: cytochrome d ubiquinol oxidase subunit II [Acidobacterium]ACO33436.1 cytochrome d ubiquinol oxidase, subunit II [Acidobacterium capsulatum ATCC 51196]